MPGLYHFWSNLWGGQEPVQGEGEPDLGIKEVRDKVWVANNRWVMRRNVSRA